MRQRKKSKEWFIFSLVSLTTAGFNEEGKRKREGKCFITFQVMTLPGREGDARISFFFFLFFIHYIKHISNNNNN